MSKCSANKIDKHVARRLRLRRSLLGMSSKILADNIGLSYQKIHALEKGNSPVTAGWLFEFGKALDVPIAYFYEGLYKNAPLETALQELSDLPAAFFEDNFFIQPENFELLGNFHHIKSQKLQKDIYNLLRTIKEELS